MDLKAELEQSRSDVAELTSRIQVYEKQLEERGSSEDRNDGAEGRAGEQTTRAELDRIREELRAVNECLANEKDTTATLTTRINGLEDELGGLRDEWQRRETNLSELHARTERERKAIARDTELDHYRTLEAERAKWEARKQRAVEQLESVRRELHKGEEGVVYTMWRDKLGTVEEQLQMANDELCSCKRKVEQLQEEKESMVLQMEELNAEVALLQAKLRRQYRLGETTGVSGGGTILLASAGGTATDGSRLRADALHFTPTTGVISMSLPCPCSAEIPAISSTGTVLSIPHTPSAVTLGVGTTPSTPCPSGVIVLPQPVIQVHLPSHHD